MKIGLISLGFPNFRYDYAQKYLNITLEKLKENSYSIISCEKTLIDETAIKDELIRIKSKAIDLLIVQCGTYSYGSSMMEIIQEFNQTPLLLWGFREPFIEGFRGLPLNSLCGLNMYGSFLKKVDTKYSYVYGDIDDPKVYEKINSTIKAIDVKTKLHHSKFCIIGGRVPGFYLSNVDELRFRHEMGPEIVYYSIASLLDDIKAIPQDLVDAEMKAMIGEASEITTTTEMFEKSARLYLAIKHFKEENNIDAFTIKCWPEFQALNKCSVCGVVSRLNNEGIMTSCEGDITGLTTMYIQYLITGNPCFFADLVNINKEGIAKAWHCGSAPICLARDTASIKYTEHPTIKQGMGFAVEFKIKLGKLVMLKLKESKNNYKLFLATGEGVLEDRDLVANQADIKFDADPNLVLDTIMKNGIEHHYAIVYEDIKDILIELCKWMDIEAISCV